MTRRRRGPPGQPNAGALAVSHRLLRILIKTIYYRDGGKVMAATLARDPALRVASRALLFDGPYVQDFDVSRDGRRFLMIETRTPGLRLVAVPNWRSELRQLTSPGKR